MPNFKISSPTPSSEKYAAHVSPTDVQFGQDDAVSLQHGSCHQSWKSAHLLKLNGCILCLVLFASANGYDGSLINCLQALPKWQEFFDTPTGAWLGFVASAYWIGTLLAFVIVASISNRFGRKVGLYIGLVLVVVGTAIQTASTNSSMFVVSRAVLGMAAGFWGATAPVLINEIAFPSHRAVASAMYQCVGGTLAAWVTFGSLSYTNDWSWRIPSLLQASLPLLIVPGVIFTPQSPRWLVSKGRNDEALRIIADWHAGGDVSDPLVLTEMREIEDALMLEKEATKSSYMDMIATTGNRRRLFITFTLAWFSQWCGSGVVSFYLSSILNSVGVTSAKEQLIITACLQVWNLLWAVGAASSVQRFGKRLLFLSSATVMLVSYTVITALSATFANDGSRAAGLAVVPFLFIFFAGYGIALTPLLIAYPAELWPYSLRSRGVTSVWFFANVSAIFNIIVNPIALDAIAWKYYFVFLAFALMYGLVAFFCYPETRNLTLEDAGELMDQPASSILKMGRARRG